MFSGALYREERLTSGASPSADYVTERGRIGALLEFQRVEKEVVEAPQLQRIYAERAARFEALGDTTHAGDMASRAAHWQQVGEDALERALELDAYIPPELRPEGQ